ncbi:molybdenum ABC transporter permease [Elizabethkingia anophelis]|uniref:molybdenum ABC transporter permease n=1 Tax=Elizabethkingia anophelis TaxID=1117645 RepID=UPI0020B89911|nr:molybdenum ABC transporter permease [Elizabethkingia anophelis]UTG62125.1 molybdenum ABC transporter permease [Elizabethkingia anophelis]UXM68393.1 molybdenum ABC transporter permease [Elizabethkingia anophelis]
MYLLIISIVFLLLGFSLRYLINRRKFNRRGVGGIEEFSSYEKATILRYVERFGKWIAYILIAVGLLYLWRFYRHTDENKNTVGKVVTVAIGKFNAE